MPLDRNTSPQHLSESCRPVRHPQPPRGPSHAGRPRLVEALSAVRQPRLLRHHHQHLVPQRTLPPAPPPPRPRSHSQRTRARGDPECGGDPGPGLPAGRKRWFRATSVHRSAVCRKDEADKSFSHSAPMHTLRERIASLTRVPGRVRAWYTGRIHGLGLRQWAAGPASQPFIAQPSV